ncbi:hypothetical protein ACS0TY_006188 [Phlomoides rotata]
MKNHWGILRKVPIDPSEQQLNSSLVDDDVVGDNVEYVPSVESSPEWSGWRDELAQNMWAVWQNATE